MRHVAGRRRFSRSPGPWIHPDAMRRRGDGRDRPRVSVRRDPLRRKDGHADESAPPVNLDGARTGRTPYAPTSARRARRRLSRDAVPVRRVEEQAVLRPVASGDRVHRDRRAGERQDRHARGPRRRARGTIPASTGRTRCAATSRSSAARAASSRASEREAVPLRRQQHEAVLRRQPRARGIQELDADFASSGLHSSSSERLALGLQAHGRAQTDARSGGFQDWIEQPGADATRARFRYRGRATSLSDAARVSWENCPEPGA